MLTPPERVSRACENDVRPSLGLADIAEAFASDTLSYAPYLDRVRGGTLNPNMRNFRLNCSQLHWNSFEAHIQIWNSASRKSIIVIAHDHCSLSIGIF